MTHSRIALHAVERYLEALLALCSPGSPTGRQLEIAENGTWGAGSNKNAVEDRLLRLADMFPGVPTLSMRELQILVVYCLSVGGRFVRLGRGGEVVEQWASGVNDKKAAQVLGFRGQNASRNCRRAYVKVLKKLGIY